MKKIKVKINHHLDKLSNIPFFEEKLEEAKKVAENLKMNESVLSLLTKKQNMTEKRNKS